ncbi:uncharacterized protein LOC144639515, partial [Oculina patagonica]
MGNGYILDRDITSSSVQNASTPAKNARLNYIEGSSWCAAANDRKPYLQINLDRLYIICAVSTQGNSQGNQWIKTYTLQSSTDGKTWKDYQEAGIVKIFHGNFDRNTTVKRLLCNGVFATRLRIIAQDHHGNCCMRTELYGLSVRIGDKIDRALNQPAIQSSQTGFAELAAKAAVDGNADSCSQTDYQQDPWWRVDLGSSLPVAEVSLHYLSLEKFEIRIGDDSTNGGTSNPRCGGLQGGYKHTERTYWTMYCLPRLVGQFVFIRSPGDYNGVEICQLEVYSERRISTACQNQAIGLANRLPDKSFSASSSRFADEPYKGRLHGKGAWAPAFNYKDGDDFLQIDLGDIFVLCAVATQGHPLQDEWTKSYKLHLLLTEWIIYKENNKEKKFSGNWNRNQLVKHVLIEPPTARAVRFQPIDYEIYEALRVELYGIKIPA